MPTHIISGGYEKVIHIMRWRIAWQDSQAILNMASESWETEFWGIFFCGAELSRV